MTITNLRLPTLSPQLRLRIISAAILAPIVLLAIWKGGIGYQLLVLVAAVLMTMEWRALIAHSEQLQLGAHAMRSWEIGGIAYVTVPCASLLILREMDAGLQIIIWLFLCVWATDIAAYAAGRLIGGPKLAPSISPNKTWAGLAGGAAAATLVGIITAISLHSNVSFFAVISFLLAVIAQGGDLFESWVKRRFGVKDSGTLIPGHGGILDRVDGIIAAAPYVLLIILLFSQRPFGGISGL